MEIYIFYITMFMIGTLLGSFFTLAIHRIPNGQNITHKRSYCPNCNHQLEFLELIPILSYVFLRGRCKHCGKKISARYIFLELFSGIIILLFTISVDIDIYRLNIVKIISLVLGVIYISTLIMIGGIDKKTCKISKGIIIFGLIFQTMYIIYVYTLEINIEKYIMYLGLLVILFFIDTLYSRKKEKSRYPVQLSILCMYIVLGSGEEPAIFSIIAAIILIAVGVIISKIKKKKRTAHTTKKVSIASWICFSNIALFLIESFLG